MAIQWKKNALGAIQCAFRHARFLWTVPNYYTYLIFPSHKGLQVLQPFLLLLAALSLSGVIVSGEGLMVAAQIVLFFLILSIGSAGLLFAAMKSELARGTGSFLHPLSWIRTFF